MATSDRVVIVVGVRSSRASAEVDVARLKNGWVTGYWTNTFAIECYQDENPDVVENRPIWL